MRRHRWWGWCFLVVTLGIYSCSSDTAQHHYCNTDDDCESGRVCGTTDCRGLPTCIAVGCACTPDGFINPCGAGTPSCNCDDATCEQPLNSCGNDICPGVCELGDSCQFCLEGADCERVSPCLSSWCLVDVDLAAKCRPLDCVLAIEPPLCGSADAICGERCPEANCNGRECGEAPLTGTSCGTCGAHRYCIDYRCRQDSQYLLCEGDLQAVAEEVETEQVVGTIPEPEGGVITDGIYDLVVQREYQPNSVADLYIRSAMRFSESGTQVEHIYDADLSSQADDQSPHRHMSVSLDGATLSFTVTCPDRSHVIFPNFTRGFTVRDDELWLIQRTVVEIYKRRP